MKRRISGAALGLAIGFAAMSASASPLFTLSNGDDPFRNESWSFGEIFTVGAGNLTVTALGAYDAGGDGFVSDGGIPVGIYRESDGMLLASTNVTSADPLSAHYRYSDIAPLVLLAGQQYRVVAVNLDDLYNVEDGFSVHPGVAYDRYAYCGATTLTVCADFTGSGRVWMANLNFEQVAVPEPATLGLFGLGLAGLGAARRRKAA